MYPSQQPTLKPWQPPTRLRLLTILGKRKTQWVSPKSLVGTLRIMQHSISQHMINLHKEGLFDRISCPCGRGFLYKITKAGLKSR